MLHSHLFDVKIRQYQNFPRKREFLCRNKFQNYANTHTCLTELKAFISQEILKFRTKTSDLRSFGWAFWKHGAAS